MKYQLVIFDWDGTLMDSTGRIVSCMQAAAKDMGLPDLSGLAVQQIIGLGLPEAIQTLYPHTTAAQVLATRDRYVEHFIAAEATPSELFAGAQQVLDTLNAEAVTMAVATGKSRRGLERVWASTNLGRYFAYSRCTDESGSKPDPRMLHDILDQLAVRPEDALMVGDTSFDLEMAQRAGIDRVGVTYGAHARGVLEKFAPLALCDDITDLLPLLNVPVLNTEKGVA
jgi:phosphoglycolate phosphatase